MPLRLQSNHGRADMATNTTVKQSAASVVITPPAGGVLTPATRKRVATVSKNITEIKDDAKRLATVSRQELEEVAEKYSRAPSSFLAAIAGGVLGSGGGIALGTLGTTAVIVTGPLGLALGAAIAVLAFRGRSYWRLENATHKARGAMELIRAQIDSLPSDAPDNVKVELYEIYRSLAKDYALVAHGAIV